MIRPTQKAVDKFAWKFSDTKTIFCGDLYPDPDPKISSWNIYCRAMLCVARLMPSCGVRLCVCHVRVFCQNEYVFTFG